MEKKDVTFVELVTILTKWRRFIFFSTLIAAILAVLISLIVPVWYKSTAKILPPSDEMKSIGISALLSRVQIPSSLLGLAGVSEGASLSMAILESRTVMEAVVKKFNLIDRYKVKDIERAVKILQKRTSFKIDDEGTITISVTEKTNYFPTKTQKEVTRVLVQQMADFFIYQLDSLNKALQTEKARNIRIFLEKRCKESFMELAREEDELKRFQEKYGTISLPNQVLVAIESAAALKAQIVSKEVEVELLRQSVGQENSQFLKEQLELEQLKAKYEQFNSGSPSDNLFLSFHKIPRYGLEYARHLRNIKIYELVLEFLVPQYEQARLQEARDTPTIQIIDKAFFPIRKIKPKRALVVLFSSFFTFIFSFIFVLSVERIQRIKLESPDVYRKLYWIKTQFAKDFKFLKKD